MTMHYRILFALSKYTMRCNYVSIIIGLDCCLTVFGTWLDINRSFSFNMLAGSIDVSLYSLNQTFFQFTF